MHITDTQLTAWVGGVLWPFFRIAAMFLAAPVVGAATVPARVRILLAFVLAWVLAPVLPAGPPVLPFGLETLLISMQQVLIGLGMGLILQLVFTALVIGGQTIAMSMGLGFASMIDPETVSRCRWSVSTTWYWPRWCFWRWMAISPWYRWWPKAFRSCRWA